VKITVITAQKGKVIGAFHGHAQPLKAYRSAPGARPVAGPGQTFHELEVPDDLLPKDASPEQLASFPKRVKKYLPKGRSAAR